MEHTNESQLGDRQSRATEGATGDIDDFTPSVEEIETSSNKRTDGEINNAEGADVSRGRGRRVNVGVLSEHQSNSLRNQSSECTVEEQVEEHWEDEIVERQVDCPPSSIGPLREGNTDTPRSRRVSQSREDDQENEGDEEAVVSTPNGSETTINQRRLTSIPSHNRISRRYCDSMALQRDDPLPEKGRRGPRQRTVVFRSKNGNETLIPRNSSTANNNNNTTKTREAPFRDNPPHDDDYDEDSADHQGSQTYFWKRGGRNTTTNRNGEEGQVVTAEDAPRPRHVETVLRTGQADYANRRWIQFARPGAVQMDSRAPYSGGFSWRIMQAGARQRRQQQIRSAQQGNDEGTHHSEPIQEEHECASPPNHIASAAREEQSEGLPAFVVDDELPRHEDYTVIEGVHVGKIEQSQNDVTKSSFMATLAPRMALLSFLVVLVTTAVILALTMNMGGDTTVTHSETNGTRAAKDEFPIELITAVQNITSGEDLLLPGSSQNRAMKWILGHNETNRRHPGDPRFLQRYVLAVFVFAAKLDENMPTSFYLLEESRDECRWRGISCTTGDDALVMGINFVTFGFANHRVSGTLASELGALTELAHLLLGPLGLEGTIPPELSDASQLKVMNLKQNNLRAPFPNTFQNHPSLELVSLDRNPEFGGTIPKFFSTLSALTHFGANWCSLTGTIPTEIGLFQSLKLLFLEGNNLTGTLPSELGSLNNLELLAVGKNQLTGRMTEPIVKIWPQLKRLVLANNRFTGQIPNSIPEPRRNSSIVETKELFLHGNMLSGTIPSTLAYLTPIRNLTLHDNRFTGVMPSEICEVVFVDHIGNFRGVNLTADCATTDNQPVEVVCTCCRSCV